MPRRVKSILAELPEPETIDVRALLEAVDNGEYDLICVLGPTASGKTAYAVRLARELNRLSGTGCESTHFSGTSRAEIISADSRQIYRKMDIGTGKDIGEYGEIPYHIIDILPAGEQYSVYRYTEDFRKAYEDIRTRGGIPILCGGTGLYINAVTASYDFISSKPLSGRREVTSGLKTFFIGTLVDRDTRNSRIDARLDARLNQGLIEEVRSLIEDDGVPAETLIAYGLEYKFVTEYILGELTYEQMRALLATAIHQFAKRQMTWFRGMERSGALIHWTSPNSFLIASTASSLSQEKNCTPFSV